MHSGGQILFYAPQSKRSLSLEKWGLGAGAGQSLRRRLGHTIDGWTTAYRAT